MLFILVACIENSFILPDTTTEPDPVLTVSTSTPGTTVTTPSTTTTTPTTPTVTSSTTAGDTGLVTTTTTTTSTGTVEPPGPIVMTGNCSYGYPYTTWADPKPTEPELHMVGIYESNGGHGGPPGQTTVEVLRETEMVLLLSSYEDVEWTVTAAKGTVLNEIVVSGYTPQVVYGPKGVTVTNRSPYTYWLGTCGYEWPYSTGGCDEPLLVANIERLTGLKLSSFQGCYHGRAFRIE